MNEMNIATFLNILKLIQQFMDSSSVYGCRINEREFDYLQ